MSDFFIFDHYDSSTTKSVGPDRAGNYVMDLAAGMACRPARSGGITHADLGPTRPRPAAETAVLPLYFKGKETGIRFSDHLACA